MLQLMRHLPCYLPELLMFRDNLSQLGIFALLFPRHSCMYIYTRQLLTHDTLGNIAIYMYTRIYVEKIKS